MRFVRIRDKEITLLSNDDMVRFIERIYNTIDTNLLMQLSKSADELKENVSRLSEFLVQYAISTGDISQVSINKIASNFMSQISRYGELQRERVEDKTGRMAKEILFEDIVMPEIIQYWARKLDLTSQISLNNIADILDAVFLQSQNNKFHTHSFNSAILEDVEKYGLDISKEYFREELRQFAPVGNQPFKTGVLNTCEMSAATFGYASIVPERVRNTFASSEFERQDGELLTAFLKRSVDYKLANNKALSVDQIQTMRNNAYHIIDFYYGHTKASVAVIKQNKEISSRTRNYCSLMMSALYDFSRMPETSKILSRLSVETRSQIRAVKRTNEDALILLESILQSARNEGAAQESAVQQLKKYICGHSMCKEILNNFTSSFGSGYNIEGGKIDRSQFAIATYNDPYKLYSMYRSHEKQDVME